MDEILLLLMFYFTMQLHRQLDQEKGEFALNKDVDVQLWIDYRAHNRLPPLIETLDSFVIVTTELFEEFGEFKKNEAIPKNFSWIEINELLSYWMR